jgi:hypothetical protein
MCDLVDTSSSRCLPRPPAVDLDDGSAATCFDPAHCAQ